eukprot:s6279_g10.t1
MPLCWSNSAPVAWWASMKSCSRRLLDFFRLRKKTRTRYNWAILREVHQSPGLIWAITAPQVRTLLALEVRLDVGFLGEAVDAVQKQAESREKAKHPVPHANPRVEQPEQPLVTELCRGAAAGGCCTSPL